MLLRRQLGRFFSAAPPKPNHIQQLAQHVLSRPQRGPVLLSSPDGTGKTLAYLRPVLNALQINRPQRQTATNCVILVPSHELAVQTAAEVKNLHQSCSVGIVSKKTAETNEETVWKTRPRVLIATPKAFRSTLDEYKPVWLKGDSHAVKLKNQRVQQVAKLATQTEIDKFNKQLPLASKLTLKLLSHVRYVIADEADKILKPKVGTKVAKPLPRFMRHSQRRKTHHHHVAGRVLLEYVRQANMFVNTIYVSSQPIGPLKRLLASKEWAQLAEPVLIAPTDFQLQQEEQALLLPPPTSTSTFTYHGADEFREHIDRCMDGMDDKRTLIVVDDNESVPVTAEQLQLWGYDSVSLQDQFDHSPAHLIRFLESPPPVIIGSFSLVEMTNFSGVSFDMMLLLTPSSKVAEAAPSLRISAHQVISLVSNKGEEQIEE